MSELRWKTFNEWSNSGYLILKGSKGTKIDGVYKFSSNQVKKKEIPGDRAYGYGRSWDNADDLNTCGGPDYGIYGNCD